MVTSGPDGFLDRRAFRFASRLPETAYIMSQRDSAGTHQLARKKAARANGDSSRRTGGYYGTKDLGNSLQELLCSAPSDRLVRKARSTHTVGFGVDLEEVGSRGSIDWIQVDTVTSAL